MSMGRVSHGRRAGGPGFDSGGPCFRFVKAWGSCSFLDLLVCSLFIALSTLAALPGVPFMRSMGGDFLFTIF